MARKATASVRRARATAGAGEELAQVTAKKAVPDPDKDPLALPSFMAETNGGGSPEDVPGFDIFRAVTAGFTTRRIAGPTILAARPDGAFFSQGSLAPSSQGQMVAAFGGGSPASKPEIVIGADSRVLVPNTSTTPWRCICHLEVEYESGPVGFGTGFFAGPKAVITAAHVLIDRSGPDWSRLRKAINIRVIPGRNGTMAPYGYFVSDFERCQLSDLWRDPRSRQEDALAADYAMIPTTDDFWTKDQPTAERLGYFGLKAFTDAEATEKAEMLFVNNAGYPYEASKPYGTLWYNAGRVRKMGKTFIEYMVDTEGGQSGSPIYYFDDQLQQRYVIAIYTTGDFMNRGLRITPAIFHTIRTWAGR